MQVEHYKHLIYNIDDALKKSKHLDDLAEALVMTN